MHSLTSRAERAAAAILQAPRRTHHCYCRLRRRPGSQTRKRHFPRTKVSAGEARALFGSRAALCRALQICQQRWAQVIYILHLDAPLREGPQRFPPWAGSTSSGGPCFQDKQAEIEILLENDRSKIRWRAFRAFLQIKRKSRIDWGWWRQKRAVYVVNTNNMNFVCQLPINGELNQRSKDIFNKVSESGQI